MLPYDRDFESRPTRRTSLQPRAHRDSRRQQRHGGMVPSSGDGIFGDLMSMHQNTMKEFDNMHKDMFGSGFGSK